MASSTMAIERKADLIILSLPYRVRFGDFYLGPTTMYVLKHAPCRVWICREEMPTEETP
jgi:nucleotide-binding universal stress UspA family protein